MRISGLAFVVVLVSVVAGCVGCHVPAGPLTVPLVYRPTEFPEGAQAIINGEVNVTAVDERAKKDAIGQNIELKKPIAILTQNDPATFVKDALSKELTQRGMVVVKTAAKRQIVLHLLSFWTDESTTYVSEVQVKAEVFDGGGKPLWSGLITGQATNFGHSLRANNYQEVFSNATMKLCNALLADSGFVAAIKQ